MEEIHLPPQRKSLRRRSGNRRLCEVQTSFINAFSFYSRFLPSAKTARFRFAAPLLKEEHGRQEKESHEIGHKSWLNH